MAVWNRQTSLQTHLKRRRLVASLPPLPVGMNSYYVRSGVSCRWSAVTVLLLPLCLRVRQLSLLKRKLTKGLR